MLYYQAMPLTNTGTCRLNCMSKPKVAVKKAQIYGEIL